MAEVVCSGTEFRGSRVVRRWLLVAGTLSLLAGTAPGAQQQLDDPMRRQIDTLALQLPPEAVTKQKRETFRDLKSWLTRRAPLPREEEKKLVAAAHDRITTAHRVLPTPDIAAEVLEQLSAALPEGMRSPAGDYTLTVIDRESQLSASAGLNRLYVSRATLERTGDDRERVAFLLSRQIGSSALKHCRRWYQARWTAELSDRPRVETAVANVLTSHSDDPVLDRQPTVNEVFAEDLFALHLCRMAGLDTDGVLDELRLQVLSATDDLSDVGSVPASAKKPLRRLRRLLMEQTGQIVDEQFGLQRYEAGTWNRVDDGELRETQRAVVVLHGLGSDVSTFDGMLGELIPSLPEGIPVIGLRYPDTGSLFRSSRFLRRELERTGGVSTGFDFVCHSAGGLVFRRAAEYDGLTFGSATLIGTPSAGSDLTRLRPLVEAQEFFSSLKGTFSRSLAGVIEDDTAQMVHDLAPSSLFLAELNGPCVEGIRDRYRIVRGRALSTRKSLLLATGMGAARTSIRTWSGRRLSGAREAAALHVADRLRLPQEVRHGDLAVTLTSATTRDPAAVLTVRASHGKLVDEPEVIEFVRAGIQD